MPLMTIGAFRRARRPQTVIPIKKYLPVAAIGRPDMRDDHWENVAFFDIVADVGLRSDGPSAGVWSVLLDALRNSRTGSPSPVDLDRIVFRQRV
jgi:hypothetical protein